MVCELGLAGVVDTRKVIVQNTDTADYKKNTRMQHALWITWCPSICKAVHVQWLPPLYSLWSRDWRVSSYNVYSYCEMQMCVIVLHAGCVPRLASMRQKIAGKKKESNSYPIQ